MNECVKFLLELDQLFDFLDVKDIFMLDVNTIYNNNQACVNWSKSTTTKVMDITIHADNFIHSKLQKN